MAKDYCRICGDYCQMTKHHSLSPRKKWKDHPDYNRLVILICAVCHTRIHQIIGHTPEGDDAR